MTHLARAGAAALLLASLPLPARACPCRGTAGPGSALTSPGETAGVALSLSYRSALGAFDDRGRHHAYGSTLTDRALELSPSAALRLADPVEVAVFAPLVWAEQKSGAAASTSAFGIGDTSVRLRLDAISNMPASELPTRLALSTSLRTPTGALPASATPSQTLSPSLGQGAYEMAFAIDARFSPWSALYELGLLGEVAYRFPDSRTGVSRELGTRALARALVSWFPDASLSFGGFGDLTVERDITYAGVVARGSGARSLSFGFFGSWQPSTLWRLSLFTQLTPPVDGVAVNGVSSFAAGTSVLKGF